MAVHYKCTIQMKDGEAASEGWSAVPWASELFPAHLIAIDYASDDLPYQQGSLSV